MKTTTFHPALENLEDRLVPATLPTINAYIDIYRDITIVGVGDKSDIVNVRPYTDWQGVKWIQVNQVLNDNNVTVKAFKVSAVTGGDINFWGYGGDDKFDGTQMDLRINAYGGAGKDEIWGGIKNDYLDGGSEDDWIAGMAGNDILIGGTGRDTLGGSDGDDTLYGGNDGQADFLSGGSGYDWFQTERFWNGKKWVNRDQPAYTEAIDRFFS